jgi:hypothetical protein
MQGIVCGFLILILAIPANAFEPNKHAVFSREASSVYQSCTGRVLPEKLIRGFTEGSVREDDITLERARNWHFYNRDGKIGTYRKYYLTCEGSNERIFWKRLDTLDHLIAAGRPLQEIYAAAGRVVHHIQDMSSPPHAMPIYHVGDDKFDKYEAVPKILDVSKICEDVNAKIYLPHDLLEKAANNTLIAVDGFVVFDGDKTIESESWLKFWGGHEDESLAGFRTYGEYGNVFGRTPPCDSEICDAYSKNVYDRFYHECRTRAVTDTVRFLLYLDSRISK